MQMMTLILMIFPAVVRYNNVPYIGKILAVDGIAGYHVQTLDVGLGNCFWWSNEKPIWYKEKVTLAT